MAILKVYNGSSFVTAVGKVYNGSAWEDAMKFYDGSSFVDLFASGDSGTVTVSGELINHVSTGTKQYRATLLIRQDGTTDKIVFNTTTQIDVSTDWVIPNSAGPGGYQVRFVNASGDTFNGITNMVEDTWQNLSDGDAILEFTESLGSGQQRTNTFTIEIRTGGVTQDTGVYTLTIHRVF